MAHLGQMSPAKSRLLTFCICEALPGSVRYVHSRSWMYFLDMSGVFGNDSMFATSVYKIKKHPYFVGIRKADLLLSFNWLLGIGAAAGPVGVWRGNGGSDWRQSGIIRGGRSGLKLPKEQPASQTSNPPDCTMSPTKVSARQWQVFPEVSRRDGCASEWGESVRIWLVFSFPPLGAEHRRSWVFLQDFFYLKGNILVQAFSPPWSTHHPRNHSSHPGQMLSP